MPSPFTSTHVGRGSGGNGCFGLRELFFFAVGGGNTGLAEQGRVYVVSVAGGGDAVLAGSWAGSAVRPKNNPAKRTKKEGTLIPGCGVNLCAFMELKLPDSAALASEAASCVVNPATRVSGNFCAGSMVPLSEHLAQGKELCRYGSWMDEEHGRAGGVCEEKVM